jgi:hypothetical protein
VADVDISHIDVNQCDMDDDDDNTEDVFLNVFRGTRCNLWENSVRKKIATSTVIFLVYGV